MNRVTFFASLTVMCLCFPMTVHGVALIPLPPTIIVLGQDEPNVGTLEYVQLRQQQLTDSLAVQVTASAQLATIVEQKVEVTATLQQLAKDEIAQNRVVISAKEAVKEAADNLAAAISDYLARLQGQ